jgi:hypothetical protein
MDGVVLPDVAAAAEVLAGLPAPAIVWTWDE